jgi:DMSO/TMAO reductase YedYZ molybdopterin-dependent catalytic subunit
MSDRPRYHPDAGLEARRLEDRRRFLRLAGAGTVVAALGGWYLLAEDERSQAARAERLPDGRSRLPPGQRVIEQLKPMGGWAGSPSKSSYRLRVHGAVEAPFELDFATLLGAAMPGAALPGDGSLALPQTEQVSDVHCVTGWSRLGARWTGVRVAELVARAEPLASARHVVFEAAHGYTANVPLAVALADDSLVAHRYDGEPLAGKHGAPVRAVIPRLYFWKSAKWLTGIRVVERDDPGYWETRGYHNFADPWLEQRYG